MDALWRKSRNRVRLLVFAAVFVWYAGSVSCFGQSQDSEFTFLLPAGRSECFFQNAVKNGTMEVEYQVTVYGGSEEITTQCLHSLFHNSSDSGTCCRCLASLLSANVSWHACMHCAGILISHH